MPASLQAPTSAAAVSAVSHPFACFPHFFRTTKLVFFKDLRPRPQGLEAPPQGPGGPAPRPGGPDPKLQPPFSQKALQAPAPRFWRPRSWRPQALVRPAPGPPFFATIRVHPKYGRHNCAGARTDTPGIWTGKNIHNPTATKNYVSTKLPRLESATPTATRQYVFADEVPHPHGTDIASTAYDDRRDLAAVFAASLRPYSFYACWSRRSYDPRASTPAITRKHTRSLILLRRGLPWPIRLINYRADQTSASKRRKPRTTTAQKNEARAHIEPSLALFFRAPRPPFFATIRPS